MGQAAIDWPLTLEWWTFAASLVAAVGTCVAIWFARRADKTSAKGLTIAERNLELSETALNTSPAAEDLSPQELFVLDEIEKGGSRLNRYHLHSSSVGNQVFVCTRMENARLVGGREQNPQFYGLIERLLIKNCLEPPGGGALKISDKGRGLLRRDRNHERIPVPMGPPPGP